MQARHMPAVIRWSLRFVLRHSRRMLAHTLGGSSVLKSPPRLEDERRAFERYRAIRRAERSYV